MKKQRFFKNPLFVSFHIKQNNSKTFFIFMSLLQYATCTVFTAVKIAKSN